MGKRFLSFFLVAALIFSVSCASPGGGKPVASGQLNLYTWEGMFPQDVLDGFTADTGVKINYVNFDTDETMLAKLQTANGGDYDLIIADDYIIQTAIASNLAQKLDKSKMSNYGNINPMYQGQFFDPTNEYTVPYGAGVLTLMYDPSVVKADIQGYSDLWDPSLKNSVGLIANYRVIDGVALKVLGESFNTNDLNTIQKAGDKLLALAPNVHEIKDDGLQDDLLSGEISAYITLFSITEKRMKPISLFTSRPTRRCMSSTRRTVSSARLR